MFLYYLSKLTLVCNDLIIEVLVEVLSKFQQKHQGMLQTKSTYHITLLFIGPI